MKARVEGEKYTCTECGKLQSVRNLVILYSDEGWVCYRCLVKESKKAVRDYSKR